jgi:nucleoside-triphosphatase THEP1
MMADRVSAPGAPRHRRLMGLAALACVGIQLPGTVAWASTALGLWLGLLAVVDRAVLRALWRPRFWTFALVLAAASGLLLGPRQPTGAWSVLSRQGLEAGLLMVLRGAFIFALACWASRTVGGDEIRRAAGRIGLPGLGTALSVALSLLPELSLELRRLRPSPRPGGVRGLAALGRRAQESAVWLVMQTTRLAEAMAVGRPARISLGGLSATAGKRPLLAAVVGPPGSGKTTLVSTLASRLRQDGLRVGGVIQPAVFGGERSVGYRVRDLWTGRERPLASRPEHGDGTGTGPRGFCFEPASWTWARERLLHACDQADVLVVDELGRLEGKGEGHLPALLSALDRDGPGAFLLAVRADCSAAIQNRAGAFDLILAPDADETEVESLLDRLRRAASASLAARTGH